MNDDGYFDERIAARYDETSAAMFDPAVVGPTVDLLAELAGSGRVLEFGIGTGRIALPLAERGVSVSGIELSNAMVAQLREKPGGTDIDVTIGDFSTATVEGSFSLVYLVYNTIENLTTQAGQVACFRNAAAHLGQGGSFLIEVGVPGLQRLPPGETYQVFYGSDDYWGIDEYDLVNQILYSHHVENVDGRFQRFSAPYRFAWPAEFDLMAELGGMHLRDRWSGWKKEPFTSESRGHVYPSGRSGWPRPQHDPGSNVPSTPAPLTDPPLRALRRNRLGQTMAVTSSSEASSAALEPLTSSASRIAAPPPPSAPMQETAGHGRYRSHMLTRVCGRIGGILLPL